MKWTRGHQSDYVHDVRGRGGGAGIGMGNLIGLLPMLLGRRGGSKWIMLLLLAAAVWWFMGGGMNSLTGGGAPEESNRRIEDEQGQFIAYVFDDVQDTWNRKLPEMGKQYQPAHLMIFSGAVPTACGTGTSAVGPFYCPNDGRAYIDLDFYRDLSARLGAPGDFAQAYVIAHEVGHHVQNLMGTNDRVHHAKQTGAGNANRLSVALELQADCYAGVWAHDASRKDLVEPGDIDEALGAASAVGDDRLQKQSKGTVQPETFTHGTAAQRSEWFRRGYEAGNPAVCDTFSQL